LDRRRHDKRQLRCHSAYLTTMVSTAEADDAAQEDGGDGVGSTQDRDPKNQDGPNR
jgi:hypothetical protein